MWHLTALVPHFCSCNGEVCDLQLLLLFYREFHGLQFSLIALYSATYHFKM